MNVESLKVDIRKAMLNKESVKLNLLRVILADVERYNKDPVNIVQKLIEDNKSNYELSKNEDFLRENDILNSMLPKFLSVEELRNLLNPLNLDKSPKSIGVAVKFLKEKNLVFRNEDVKQCVLQ